MRTYERELRDILAVLGNPPSELTVDNHIEKLNEWIASMKEPVARAVAALNEGGDE